MPRQRFERHEPTHEWQQLRPLLKDPTQLTYEIIRPVILGWETPKERSAETGMPQRTIYHKANLFDQAGIASLLHPESPPIQSERRHQYWFVDVRYLDMHQLGGGMIYCISILEGYSRAILASAVTRRQNFVEYVAFLGQVYIGVNSALCSDSQAWMSRGISQRSRRCVSRPPSHAHLCRFRH